MPPRKNPDAVKVSRPSNGADDEEAPPATTRAPRQGTSIDDLALPRSVVQRLAKGVLPPNTQIQNDALLAILKSATVFVNYLASNANDRAAQANKKTIRAEDVVQALPELEFETFVQRVEAEIEKYYTIQTTKRNDYRRRVKEEQTNREGGEEGESIESADPSKQLDFEASVRAGYTQGRDSPPAAKKARTSLAGTSNGYASTHDDDTIDEDEGIGMDDEELDEAEDEVEGDDVEVGEHDDEDEDHDRTEDEELERDEDDESVGSAERRPAHWDDPDSDEAEAADDSS